jgi:two-component system NarL family response regulator
MTRIRVLVVEDHFLARLAVTTLVDGEADMQVVGAAESGWQAVKLFEELEPDVVLMDLKLPEMDGVAATGAICRAHPAARILVLSHYEREEEIARVLDAGARGFLKKDVEGARLLDAIRRVARGERCVPPEIDRQLDDRDPRSGPTRRQREILGLIYKGQSNAEIARGLGISEGTVRIHVSNLLFKLGVKRRTEAVAVALKKGLLNEESD